MHFQADKKQQHDDTEGAKPFQRYMVGDQAEALRASDDICSALQLINFWQDLSIDLSRGRCYIPDSILQTHDLSAQQLLDWGKDDELTKDSNNQAIQPVIKQIISTTAERLRRGYELLPWLPFRLRLQISATLHGAERMLNKIEKLQSPLSERAKLNRKDWWQLSAPILKDALMPGRTLQTQTV